MRGWQICGLLELDGGCQGVVCVFLCMFVCVWVTMPIFPTLVLWAQRIAETKSAHIWASPCQELLVPLNVLTIICLSLSPCSLLSFLLLLNGFLSLSPPPSLTLPLQCSLSPSRPLSFNTYKTERAQSGPGLGHLEAAKADSPHLSLPPSMAPCQWPAVALYVALPILVNSNHWQLLQALFYGPPSSHGFPAAPPGRLSLAVPCLMLFCKLLSPGSLLITVQGLCKATQRRPGEGEHAGTLGGLKELRRWSIQIPNEIITTN